MSSKNIAEDATILLQSSYYNVEIRNAVMHQRSIVG